MNKFYPFVFPLSVKVCRYTLHMLCRVQYNILRIISYINIFFCDVMQLQKVKMGFAVMNSAENLIELLVTHLETTNFLYSGEGESLVHVLSDVAKYAQDKDIQSVSVDYMFLCILSSKKKVIFYILHYALYRM